MSALVVPAPDGADGDVDDASLVARVAAGDHDAFTVLVRRHVRSATLLAAQLVGDRDDAEDVVQNAFIVIYDRAGEFDGARPFGPWLYGIVRHLAARGHARTARRRRLWARWAERRHGDRVVPAVDAQVAARLELLDAGGVLASLPAMQRACFELVVMREVGFAEVAAMHGIAESTVRQHVFRARKALRRALRGNEDCATANDS